MRTRAPLQRKPGRSAEQSTGSEVVQAALQSDAQPLDPGVQAAMEPRFGHDFSQVRVHLGDQAAESADALQARAYTMGSAMVFGNGEYQPTTHAGQRLIAHELAHVVQQSSSTPLPQTALIASAPGDPAEQEAAAAAERVLAGETVQITQSATGMLQRQSADPAESVAEAPPADDTAATHPTLRFGSTGPDVVELQEKLNAHGAAEPPLVPDGIFGSLTLAAVQHFQETHTDTSGQPLVVDGIVGVLTWGALDQITQPGKPTRTISATAMARIEQATRAIEHTKSVFLYGAGNQAEALRASNFNSYFRMQVMRGEQYWQLTDEVKPIADANPDALTAAKADLVHGGNCGEHAEVAFDYLRVNAVGETINRSDVEGLDHAFVLIGDLTSETDADIVVADPWPTRATATTWDDHFAYTPDRTKLNVREQMVADGANIKAVIAAGLTLTDEGRQLAETTLSDEETEAEIARGQSNGWVWDHPNTAAEGRDFDYVSP